MKGDLDLQKLLVLIFEFGFDQVAHSSLFTICSQFYYLTVIVTWETKTYFADLWQPYYKKQEASVVNPTVIILGWITVSPALG